MYGFKRLNLCVCSINEVRARDGSGSCAVRGTNINISPPPKKNRPKKRRNSLHHLHLERRLPSFAKGTLVRLAHPLSVREAAPVTRSHEAVVQHLDVRERQDRWHVVVLYVQGGCESHERAIASSEQHARRTHVRSLCCSR
jgi:hypothetical protein